MLGITTLVIYTSPVLNDNVCCQSTHSRVTDTDLYRLSGLLLIEKWYHLIALLLVEENIP